MEYNYSKIFGEDVVIIKPEIFHDYRGEYVETWNVDLYSKFSVNFKQDDISVSNDSVSNVPSRLIIFISS